MRTSTCVAVGIGVAVVASLVGAQDRDDPLARLTSRVATLEKQLTAVQERLTRLEASPRSPARRPTESEADATVPADATPVAELEATALHLEVEANGAAAKLKYSDQVVKLRGVVTGIDTDVFKKTFIKLDSGNAWSGLQCYVSGEMEAQAAKLKKGDTIVVLGRVTSFVMGVTLKGCRLLE